VQLQDLVESAKELSKNREYEKYTTPFKGPWLNEYLGLSGQTPRKHTTNNTGV
jgi:hypothetical protein